MAAQLFIYYIFVAGKTIQNMSVAMAATKIQNLWKGAIARRQVKKQREEELGPTPGPSSAFPWSIGLTKAQWRRAQRKEASRRRYAAAQLEPCR